MCPHGRLWVADGRSSLLWPGCILSTPALLIQCSRFLPGCRWWGGLFTVNCNNGRPPPSGVSHHCYPTPMSNHHLVPRAPLTEPSNHLICTTPTDPTFHHWILEPHPSSTRKWSYDKKIFGLTLNWFKKKILLTCVLSWVMYLTLLFHVHVKYFPPF